MTKVEKFIKEVESLKEATQFNTVRIVINDIFKVFCEDIVVTDDEVLFLEKGILGGLVSVRDFEDTEFTYAGVMNEIIQINLKIKGE